MRQARMFHELAKYEGTGGTYVSVKPTQETIHKLEKVHQHMADYLDEDVLLPPMDWHVTVVYDKKAVLDPPNVHKAFPLLGTDIEFEARAEELKWWPGANNKGYLVLVLYSDELHDLHSLITEHLDLKHSFEDYTPHVTMAEKFLTKGISPEEMDSMMHHLNEIELPDGLVFSGLRFEDIS